jgi:hypothetical protein
VRQVTSPQTVSSDRNDRHPGASGSTERQSNASALKRMSAWVSCCHSCSDERGHGRAVAARRTVEGATVPISRSRNGWLVPPSQLRCGHSPPIVRTCGTP